MESGARSWLLKRTLNNLMGVTAADDVLPKRIKKALSCGGAEGSIPDEELMKKEYYELRGLNENGIPLKEVLSSYGLEYISETLYK